MSGAARATRHSSMTVASLSFRTPAAAKDANASRETSRANAQTAAPRTSGASSSRRSTAAGRSARSFELPIAIITLRRKRALPDALDRAAGEAGAERRVVEAGEFGERRSVEVGARGKLRLAPGMSEFVPRADGQAVVAAVDAIADRGSQLARDRALMLDRQVGDAAPRVDPVGRGERLGRTGVEAGAALSAMVRFGRVGRQLEVGEDRAQEQPGAEFARRPDWCACPASRARRARPAASPCNGAVSTKTFTSAFSGRAAAMRKAASSLSLPLRTS